MPVQHQHQHQQYPAAGVSFAPCLATGSSGSDLTLSCTPATTRDDHQMLTRNLSLTFPVNFLSLIRSLTMNSDQGRVNLTMNFGPGRVKVSLNLMMNLKMKSPRSSRCHWKSLKRMNCCCCCHQRSCCCCLMMRRKSLHHIKVGINNKNVAVNIGTQCGLL